MSGIFTSGLLFCVEVAFEHIHTSVKSTVHWKRSRLGAAVAEDRGGTGGGGAVVASRGVLRVHRGIQVGCTGMSLGAEHIWGVGKGVKYNFWKGVGKGGRQ